VSLGHGREEEIRADRHILQVIRKGKLRVVDMETATGTRDAISLGTAAS
jgi:hypothetical protein